MLRVLFLVLDFLVPFGLLLRSCENNKPFDKWQMLFLRCLPQSFFAFWLFSFVPLVGGFLYILVLVPLSAVRHWHVKQTHTVTARLNVLLVYLVVILIGFGGIWSFVGHTFLADQVASQIGWTIGSPFQTELAFYTLGTSIAALLAVWIRDHLITAIVLSKSVFWLGAAYVHLLDAFAHQNFSPLNVGAPLVGDIIYPVILLYLLYRYWRPASI